MILDLTSGGALTYVLGANTPKPDPSGDTTRTLVARLEAASMLVVVAALDTAAAARARAIELARGITKRTNIVACRGTQPEPGSRLVSHGDTLQALRAFKQDNSAALVIEVVQASNSACVPPPHYFQRLREGCTEAGVQLVVDETRTGLGRTGALFAFEREKIVPDLVALSLAVAPGLDGGLVLARRDLEIHPALAEVPAQAAAATLAVLDAIERERLIQHTKAAGKRMQQRLHDILETRRKWAMDTRGRGLLHSLSLWDDPMIVIGEAGKRGIRLARTGESGILFAPPITATIADLDETFAVLDEVLAGL